MEAGLQGEGVNQSAFDWYGTHLAVTPAIRDGRCYSIGTLGRVYAMDAATGKPLWESDIGAGHEDWTKRFEHWKASPERFDPNPKTYHRDMKTKRNNLMWHWIFVASPIPVGGAVICNDGDRLPSQKTPIGTLPPPRRESAFSTLARLARGYAGNDRAR